MKLLPTFGWFLVITATAWTWLSVLTMHSNACGPDKISLSVTGYGIACVQAEHWKPRAALEQSKEK